MKASDLLNSQLEHLSGEGKIIAHGRRALLIDATFFDGLQAELIGLLGEVEARSYFTRLGYSMGHTAARRLRDRYPLNDERELIAACPMLMAWSGFANATLHHLEFDHARGTFLAELAWTGSYESDRYSRQFDEARLPACWTLCGYVSGYCSLAAGQSLLCLETSCAAQGEKQCVVVVKPISAWGDAARKSAADLIRFEAMRQMRTLNERLLQRESQTNKEQRAALADALKEAQLQALESQVNPHFLFNTLNVIAKLAFLENAPETEQMAYALADLLRYSLRRSPQTNGLVTLREEIEHTRQYLLIQQTRFRDRLELQFAIDETALEIRVPRLCIQPLLENAFVHGLEPSERPGRLLLSVQRAGACIVISVQDNGVGIRHEQVQQLLADETDGSSTHWSAHTTGLGLRHVRDRLRHSYGEQCQLIIESELGSGTTVRLLLPLDGAPQA